MAAGHISGNVVLLFQVIKFFKNLLFSYIWFACMTDLDDFIGSFIATQEKLHITLHTYVEHELNYYFKL